MVMVVELRVVVIMTLYIDISTCNDMRTGMLSAIIVLDK